MSNSRRLTATRQKDYYENMKNRFYLLIALVLLYLIPALILQAVYGPSYGFMSGEDRWIPDGRGGWEMYGHPTDPMPQVPSENIPLLLPYLPIFLPAFLLIIFLFTPLTRKLEVPQPKPTEGAGNLSDKAPPPDDTEK